MATRIHNFSYSGSTGLLTFVPCTGTEKACKVYVKHIKASVFVNEAGYNNQTFSNPKSIEFSLNSKAANGTTILKRGWYRCVNASEISAGSKVDVDLVPSCNGAEVYETPIFDTGTGVKSVFMPEYFYLKPNDTLTMAGYTGTFHIELMGISED